MEHAKEHWNGVYERSAVTSLSWFQEHHRLSLELLDRFGVSATASIIDIGGGASTLVDDLLDRGCTRLTVLDVSSRALAAARTRLGERATAVDWREANLLDADFSGPRFDVWHDRAVFHFLTDPRDRRIYVQQVLRAVRPGGLVLVATFGEDGPSSCSGLPVVRYAPYRLHAEFGRPFELLAHERESHRTPGGAVQEFVYCLCRTGASGEPRRRPGRVTAAGRGRAAGPRASRPRPG